MSHQDPHHHKHHHDEPHHTTGGGKKRGVHPGVLYGIGVVLMILVIIVWTFVI